MSYYNNDFIYKYDKYNNYKYNYNDKYEKNYKFYLLPSGLRVEEYEIGKIIEVDDATYLMYKDYHYFVDLSETLRNNPEVLKAALESYGLMFSYISGFLNSKAINPINYAGKDALTKENIDLACKYDVATIKKGPVMFNPYFIALAVAKGTITNYPALSKELRNDPLILKVFLSIFDSNSNSANPISFAEDGALTEENINLALEKGKIEFIASYPLVKNALFHRLNIKKGTMVVDYSLLPGDVVSNEELMQLYIEKSPKSYELLNKNNRNVPSILKTAINNYDNTFNYLNPISYAEDGALTEDNIKLALGKGNIDFVNGYPLVNNVAFHRLNILQGTVRVEYDQLPQAIIDEENTMCLYVAKQPDSYRHLDSNLRNNSLLLKSALEVYQPTFSFSNPISYAEDGALTEDNIKLALEKGKIEFIVGYPLVKNALFHRINILQGNMEVDFDVLPEDIKKDSNLMGIYVGKKFQVFQKLDSIQRNNPSILAAALNKFDASNNAVNPISYAGDGALTEDNIKLALTKGSIRFVAGYPLVNNALFHRINILQGNMEVDFDVLPEDVKKDDNLICFYIEKFFNYYSKLNSQQRNNPAFLNSALKGFVANNNINPISYAEDGALTEDNINLALTKGNIKIIKGSPLANCRFFIIESLKKGVYTSDYDNISDGLKNDPEVIQLLNLIKPSIVGKSIDSVNHWSPYGTVQLYKYFWALIGVLPNGYNRVEEIRGRNRLNSNHYRTIENVIQNFMTLYPNDSRLQELYQKVINYDKNPFDRAILCSNNNVLIILIEGENAQLYCPRNITKDQFDSLSEMLSKELNRLHFHIAYEGEYFDDYKDFGSSEARDLNYQDVFTFIANKNIVDDMMVDDSLDGSSIAV